MASWQVAGTHVCSEVPVSDQAERGERLVIFVHGVLDRLTAMKLRVGALRLRLRVGAVAPEEIENHLDHIEQEIDATAALAQDVRAAEGSNPG